MMSVICAMLVVVRHVYNVPAFYAAAGDVAAYNYYVQYVTQRVSHIAVPAFFLISGYFFLRRQYSTVSQYAGMLRRKAETLLVPFVVWSLFGLILLLPYDVRLIGTSPEECLLNFVTGKWNGPLWYVSYLMLLMLTVPLYGWLFRYRCRHLLVVALCLMVWLWQPMDSQVFSTEGLLFFCLGGALATFGIPFDRKILGRRITYALFLFWLFSCACNPLWNFYWDHVSTFNFMQVHIPVGILVTWWVTAYLPSRVERLLLALAPYSFLIYVVHFIPQKVIKIAVARVFHGSDLASCMTYLLTIVLIPLVCYYGGRWLGKHYPRVASFICGGR